MKERNLRNLDVSQPGSRIELRPSTAIRALMQSGMWNTGLLERRCRLKGIYTIVMRLKNNVKCKVGSLGSVRFAGGVYVYTGSARGKGSVSIRGRIERHLGRRSRSFWHIDYLLATNGCNIQAFIYSETTRDLECEVNRRIQEMTHAAFAVRGFGSSDCACLSHLLYLPGHRIDQALTKAKNAHGGLRLKPRICRLD